MTEEGAPTLFVQDNTSGEYTEYTPPDPPAFHDTLPEDLRGSEHLKEVENPETLARYYVDLKKDYLAPPEAPDGYEVEFPEGFPVDEDAVSNFKKVAFENGVNQKQFTELANYEIQRYQQTMETLKTTMEAKQEESNKALKAEWGDKYEPKMEAAKSVVNRFADDGFKQFLENTRFGDSPEVIRFFAKIADQFSEDTTTQTGTGDGAEDKVQRTEDGRPMLKFPSMEK